MLGEIVRHLVGEYAGDTALVMDTLIDEPKYNYWGLSTRSGPMGRAETIASYRASEGLNRNMVVERVLVDGDHVFTEGILRLVMDCPGVADLAGPDAVVGLDPAMNYLVEVRLAIVWPFASDGKIKGEDIYFAAPFRATGPFNPVVPLFPGPVLNQQA